MNYSLLVDIGIYIVFTCLFFWGLWELGKYLDYCKQKQWEEIKKWRLVCDHNIPLHQYCPKCQKKNNNVKPV